MTSTRLAHAFLAVLFSAYGIAWAESAVPKGDPLATIDLNRNAIIADIVEGFEGDRPALAKRLAKLRADRLLAVSLASSRESLETMLADAEKSLTGEVSRAGAKVLGSPTTDLVYTPLTPCRLIDTRGFGAPIQGGAFAPNARRAYTPNGLCNLPMTGVASLLISFTTQNLTPNSGGYLAILAPLAPVTASVDVFNLGSEWSASNTAVITGSAAQFDVLVAAANAHVVIDVLGYFAPPQGGAVTSITTGTGLTGGTITSMGTVALATAFQLPQACTNGQVASSNGAGGWTCTTPFVSGGTLTAVTASAPLNSSGGNTPNVSLAGIVPVANGGTGLAGLTPNGILFGQGTAEVGTAVGGSGQVLAGANGSPAWTNSPTLTGYLQFPSTTSTATAGTIYLGVNRFMHNAGSGTYLGGNAGNFAVSGSDNTGIGGAALSSNTTGSYNTAVGSFALPAVTSGSQNTAVGTYALRSQTIGNHNTAVGYAAQYTDQVGQDNTALGYRALFDGVGGCCNTAVGATALEHITTGTQNIGLGRAAGSVWTTGIRNIAIGNVGIAEDTFTTRIGDFQVRAFMAGIRGVPTGVADAATVFVDSNGQLGTFNSSRRFKEDIADMGDASLVLSRLRPVTFYYKVYAASGQTATQYGLIAEEVADIAPDLVSHSADGSIESVHYHFLAPMLLNEYQRQQRTIAAQEARIGTLEGELSTIKRALELR